MTVHGRRVLISGASVAGPVLAYWLKRFGFQPTVVERAPEQRFGRGGHAVDLFGPALQIIEWMGALAQVRDARTRTETISFLREGHRPIDVPAELMSEGVSGRHIEIMRGDLAKIIYDCGRNDLEYVFGNSMTTLHETEQGVEVTFQDGSPRTFDLVIGADGLHSITRQLTFGDEDQFLHFLGGYFAVFTVPNYLDLHERMLGFADLDRTAAIYPVQETGQARVLLLWRARTPHDYDRHDLTAQRRLIHNLFDDMGWEMPRLLMELEKADDLYLDSISTIVMETWSRGRVTLVGDAGYSPGAAVGGGTSLAVVGAYVLASELAASSGDHVRGLAAYEQALQPAVEHSLTIGPAVLKTLIPRSHLQVWATAQAIRMLPRLPAPARRPLTSFGGGPAAMLNVVSLRDPGNPLMGQGGHVQPSVVVERRKAWPPYCRGTQVSLRFAPPRHAPRRVLLGRHTTRYPSLVGLAMHASERRQAQKNLDSTTLGILRLLCPPTPYPSKPTRATVG